MSSTLLLEITLGTGKAVLESDAGSLVTGTAADVQPHRTASTTIVIGDLILLKLKLN